MLAPVDNILRIINFLFLVISIGLISSLLNTQSGNSSRINYCMFAVAYAIVTDSLYGVFANFFEPLAWPLILFSLDFLNFVFTFTAGTVLAVGIRAHSCRNQTYLASNSITQGSGNRCREAQAAVAFLYFSCAIFLAKTLMSVFNMISNGAFGSGSFSKRRRTGQVGVPTISQV
ncbi:hypothetical protein N7582_005833 [Saccharomyces uvarum]|uniref:MARVEL domain-containing protein n=1 Tax=Saccharomyces uvarum TaxID=230603 RepID=A0AA35JC46_SACUV|nr:hypothetical protein N7582_005833 [Saccharomyces uvarum]CAI4053843.1 hypothetical protein SUVC_16G4110 [Saccharomyces uvarum]